MEVSLFIFVYVDDNDDYVLKVCEMIVYDFVVVVVDNHCNIKEVNEGDDGYFILSCLMIGILKGTV